MTLKLKKKTHKTINLKITVYILLSNFMLFNSFLIGKQQIFMLCRGYVGSYFFLRFFFVLLIQLLN